MRRFDKIKNLKKANILAEQLYLANKNLKTIKRIDENEVGDDFDTASREVEYGINPHKDQNVIVINYEELPNGDLLVQTSDGVTEKYSYYDEDDNELDYHYGSESKTKMHYRNESNTREVSLNAVLIGNPDDPTVYTGDVDDNVKIL